MMDYEEDDFEDVFCQTFEVGIQSWIKSFSIFHKFYMCYIKIWLLLFLVWKQTHSLCILNQVK